MTSVVVRGLLFFLVNLRGGLDAAAAALGTELVLRSLTSGFYGAITEAFARAEPRWAATLGALVVLPLCSHSIELVVHWMRGTDQLLLSMGLSMLFTIISTTFHLFMMRRGIMIVGPGAHSLSSDLRAMPGLLLNALGLFRGTGHSMVNTRL